MNIRTIASQLAVLGIIAPLLLATSAHAATTAPGENGLIAYTKNIRGKSSVWTMKPNGTQQKLVADNAARHPVWSPDGRTLTFTTGQSNECSNRLVILHIRTLQQRTVATGECISAPAWSADSSRLAFSQTRTNAQATQSALFTLTIDTKQQTTIAGWSTNHAFRGPAWSPDGNRIVYEQYTPETNKLIVQDLSNRSTTLLTALSEPVSAAASWSPNGKKIVYADSSNETYTIWPDGTHRSVIADGDSYDAAWSPDGTQLLFLEDRTGEALSRSASDGTVTWLPLAIGTYHSVAQPTWSPDSSKALLTATIHGRTDLLVIDLENTQATPRVLARNISDSFSWQAR